MVTRAHPSSTMTTRLPATGLSWCCRVCWRSFLQSPSTAFLNCNSIASSDSLRHARRLATNSLCAFSIMFLQQSVKRVLATGHSYNIIIIWACTEAGYSHLGNSPMVACILDKRERVEISSYCSSRVQQGTADKNCDHNAECRVQ